MIFYQTHIVSWHRIGGCPRTIFAIDRGGIGIGVLDFGEVKKKCLFPVGGIAGCTHSIGLILAISVRKLIFNVGLTNSGTREPAEAATWCLRPPSVQSPGGEIRIEAFGSDGKPLDGSKSLTEAIHQWHNWSPSWDSRTVWAYRCWTYMNTVAKTMPFVSFCFCL